MDRQGLQIQSNIPVTDTQAILKMIKRASEIQRTYSDSSLALFQNTLEKSKQAYFIRGILISIIYVGNIYADRGEYPQAVNAYSIGMYYAALPGNKASRYLATLQNNIANIYNVQANYEKAAIHYYRAAQYAEQYKATISISIIYNNLASVLLQMDKVDQALYYLEKAETNAREEKQYETLANVLCNMGSYYSNRKEDDKSIYYYKLALSIAQQAKSVPGQYVSLINLGSLYMSKGRYDSALAYIDSSAAFKGDRHINAFLQNTAALIAAQIYYNTHDYSKAITALSNAINEAEALHLMNNLLEGHLTMSKVYDETGAYKNALEQFKSYVLLKDSIENQATNKNINQLEVKYRTAEKDKELSQRQLLIAEQQRHLTAKNAWLIGTASVAILLTLLLIGVYRYYRQKEQLLVHAQEIGQLKAMMNGEEKERTRLARELHDGVGGILAATKMKLSVLQERYEQQGIGYELGDIQQMLHDAAVEVRQTSHNLMPDVLTRNSLEEALVMYCRSLNIDDRLNVELQILDKLDKLDKSTELIIYRITQELIQNIINHANATYAGIIIRQVNDKLSILVEDNGMGFDVTKQNDGMGLRNLRFRVQALQGVIYISSTEGKGTTIHIEFDAQQLKTFPAYENQDSNS